jgi:glyoxylase-like metal-dependent hydrolase (beta-lactamase superfamily II)
VATPRVVHDGLPLDAPWIHGQRRGSPDHDPVLQVRTLDPTTYVIRQSKTVTYEAPFLYLLVGAERVLLLDTGAVRSAAVCPVRETVDALLPTGLPLVVAHTHGHGDHVAGDEQFVGRAAMVAIRDGVRDAAGRPGVHDVGPARPWNGPCYLAVARQAVQLA